MTVQTEGAGAQGTDAASAAAAAAAATQTNEQTAAGSEGSSSQGTDFDYTTLSDDEATRDWLKNHKLTSANDIAKKAYNLDKFVGGAVKVPGKDATPEEKAEFFTKLGRPAEPDKYEFAVPNALPENVPYNAELAAGFKSKAHELGLSQAQAAAAHDWFVEQQVKAANGVGAQVTEQLEQIARTERGKLEKVWGPIDSESGKRNAELPDRALSAGPPELLADLVNAGVLGPNKEVLNANFGMLLSKLGAAIYTEDGVIRGNPTAVGNPFDEGSPEFNVTKQMAVYKKDPEHARLLIAAAGKQPEDFGLKAKG